MRKTIVVLLLMAVGANTYAQDISGKWVSVSASDSAVQFDYIRNYAININKTKYSIKGDGRFISKHLDLDMQIDLSGKVDISTNMLLMSDEDIYIISGTQRQNGMARRTDEQQKLGVSRPEHNTVKYKWSYDFDETSEYLRLDGQFRSSRGWFAKYIIFKRPRKEKKNPIANEPVTTTSDSTFIHPVTKRTNKVFQEIVTESDSVKVDLYDVGEIDGDSVSLFLNGKLIAEHQMLKASATSFLLKLDRSIAENKLVLFAENLGSIPPNTSYMVITTNKKEYRLNMQSDEQTNGEIVFRFPGK